MPEAGVAAFGFHLTSNCLVELVGISTHTRGCHGVSAHDPDVLGFRSAPREIKDTRGQQEPSEVSSLGLSDTQCVR